MDMLHTILDILLPPLTLIFLFLFYPFYLFIKLLSCICKHLFVENVVGKVVLITGASSGIGEHVAYEYAKKGAYLALVARREDRLQMVAETSRQLGSRDVIIIPGDVTKINDCMKFIDETISHFGKVDHLINNAGVSQTSLFEDFSQVQDANRIVVSQHMNAPTKYHWTMVERILRYLKGSLDRGIWMRRHESTEIVGYCDADWAGDRIDRRSTTGYCTFIGGNMVTWKTKKQKVVACSTAEAEYRAMRKLTNELTWLKGLLADLDIDQATPMTMHCGFGY